jgi:hypothetical protein
MEETICVAPPERPAWYLVAVSSTYLSASREPPWSDIYGTSLGRCDATRMGVCPSQQSVAIQGFFLLSRARFCGSLQSYLAIRTFTPNSPLVRVRQVAGTRNGVDVQDSGLPSDDVDYLTYAQAVRSGPDVKTINEPACNLGVCISSKEPRGGEQEDTLVGKSRGKDFNKYQSNLIRFSNIADLMSWRCLHSARSPP